MIAPNKVARTSHLYRLAAIIASTHGFETAAMVRQYVPVAREILEALKAVDDGMWNEANTRAWLNDKATTDPAPETVWPIALDVIGRGA